MIDNKPNILLITTDQQRFDTAGASAPSFMRTPHYDILCREGITFTSAYSDCPLCVPARVSIMTGKYVTTHKMSTNQNTSKVIAHENTLPAYLHSLGYQTAAIGKMHFGPERVRHGFDEMILPADYFNEIHNSGSIYKPMHHGMGQNELYPAMATVPECQTLTSWISEKCVEYIRIRRDPSVPFFIWCSYSKPHPPLDPPEPYYSMYRNCPIPAPVYGDWSEDDKCPEAFRRARQEWSFDLIPQEVIKEARAAYYGLITQVDYNMGRIFAALQDLKMIKDTLIIYTSDHGEYLGDHYAGAKSFFHEPSAHIPFVLRLPKCWNNRCNGISVTTPVTHADILPTLLKAAGGTPPADIDGIDLISLARGEIDNPRRYLEGMCEVEKKRYYAITDGRWKYIWFPEGGSEQLFDLKNDPMELKNLTGCTEYELRKRELNFELVKRHESRHSDAVKDGQMINTPIKGDCVADRRNNSGPGFRTEYYDVDVKH